MPSLISPRHLLRVLPSEQAGAFKLFSSAFSSARGWSNCPTACWTNGGLSDHVLGGNTCDKEGPNGFWHSVRQGDNSAMNLILYLRLRVCTSSSAPFVKTTCPISARVSFNSTAAVSPFNRNT